MSNQKIIGIHKEGDKKHNFNIGTLLKGPINEYLNLFNKNNKDNEIKLLVKLEKKNITLSINLNILLTIIFILNLGIMLTQKYEILGELE